MTGTEVGGFGQRLTQAVAKHGPLCAGIDPHPYLLKQWGLTLDATGLRSFVQTALEAFSEVAVLKPQVAFFERLGSAGLAVLEELLVQARQMGVLTIADAKRGDIGSTMDGYTDAFLRPGAPFEADALTVNPYLGPAVFDDCARVAYAHGKGVVVLALTSNPQGRSLQRSVDPGGRAAARQVVQWVNDTNAHLSGSEPGSVGIVLGATVEDAFDVLGEPLLGVRGPVLVPGYGTQGGNLNELSRQVAGIAGPVLVNSSRALLECGPDPQIIRRAARAANLELSAALR